MKKPKISVIIPYYEADPEKPAILKRLTDSLKGYDELILVWNDKMGYAKAINKGLAIAKGDFLVVMNDDLIFENGSVADLCDPYHVTSPVINGLGQNFWGCCFCIPRNIYDEVGGLYEGYRISYYDDDDYLNTLRKNNIGCRCVEDVRVSHPEGGRTLHTFSDHKDFETENKAKFLERWGKDPQTLNRENGFVAWEV
jgi:GT2 family glycosyltransferase